MVFAKITDMERFTDVSKAFVKDLFANVSKKVVENFSNGRMK